MELDCTAAALTWFSEPVAQNFEAQLSNKKEILKHSHPAASCSTGQWPFHVHAVAACPTFTHTPTGSTTQNKVGALQDKTLTLNYATLNIPCASIKAKLVRWRI
jgi:hypothetical protein